ncbi:hypothetical protein N7532_007140 [Penicillium argentinense]|uniref:Transcription factor domain-containing protein n=1 Tax=Penicillium argentinense TaxID=1131581 RepID=A0A9W9KBG7_9EURO|nr:uncharacterized protein N7532_007140 [Penicillium argentinense]KAJ5100139.1 hypothetical protein N7532_007140 [Penicillium argentinense]
MGMSTEGEILSGNMGQASQLIRAKPVAYVEGLVREIEQLKALNQRPPPEQTAQTNNPVIDFDQDLETTDEPSQNPLLDEKPWFLPINSSKVPILIGEVADTVFATRFRQLITGKTLSHIPRIAYPGHDQILELAKIEIPPPGASHARFILRVAVKFLEGSFHIIRKSLVSDLLDQFLHAPQSLDSLSTCKIFALFALGELHSNRFQNQETQVAGLAYYSHASRAHGLLEERPCVDSIEVSLILEIQMDAESSHLKPQPIRSLHLTFNQSVILATRPVLLHKLQMHKESNGNAPASADQTISSNVQTLAEACIRCARHSYCTIVESWIEGNFGTFDYFNTQHLFSAATVLAISCLIGGPGSSKDHEDFEFAGELLKKLRDSGSFAAMEFCRHFEELKTDIRSFWSGLPGTEAQSFEPNITGNSAHPNQLEPFLQPEPLMTSGMALAEPSVEAFLQSEQSLTQLDVFWDHTGRAGLYWPVGDLV